MGGSWSLSGDFWSLGGGSWVSDGRKGVDEMDHKIIAIS